MITKICTKCKQEKPIIEFNKDKYSKDGFTSKCKYCRSHAYESICEQCGKIFFGSHKNQRFCSKKCMGKHNNTQITFNCDYCGKESSMYKSEYEKENKKHHYCSKECKNKHMSELMSGEKSPTWKGGDIYFNCDFCGKESHQKKSQFEKQNNHFCSFECMGKYMSENRIGENSSNWKGGKVTVKCDYCNKDVEIKRYMIKYKTKNFCNQECYHKYSIGENHPRYNPNLTNEERYDNRDYNEYIIWRKEVFERDNYTCQCCNKNKGNINAHHLDGYDWCNEKRTDIDNGITLCEDCHKLFHSIYGYGKNTKEQFEDFLEQFINK